MTGAQRLEWVFDIDVETCPACGGAVRIIACIEDPGGMTLGGMESAVDGATFRVSWHPGPASVAAGLAARAAGRSAPADG